MPSTDRLRPLGEGHTPLVNADRLAKNLGLDKLYLKCEFANPTGSFKDRPVSVGVATALRYGYEDVVVASTGNGAASVSAYCARAGINAYVFVPSNTSAEKIAQSKAYGSNLVILKEGTYSDCFSLAKKISQASNYYNVTTTFYNPFTVDGNKSVGYELYEDTREAEIEYVYIPIGAGPLLVGTYRGFYDYKVVNDSTPPRMVGIQAEGNNPIVDAYVKGKVSVNAQPAPATIAGGIADGLASYPQDGTHTLQYIRKSGGHASAVTDSAIEEAQGLLASTEGIIVEPAAAAAMAGVIKDIGSGKLTAGCRVAVILTGHGLKDLSNLSNSDARRVEILPNMELSEILKKLQMMKS